jgi:hypothetical protein
VNVPPPNPAMIPTWWPGPSSAANGNGVLDQNAFWLDKARARLEEVGVTDTQRMKLPTLVDASTLLAQPPPEKYWLIDRLIPWGGFGIVVAPPKSSKSWMMLDLVRSVATGGKFLNAFDARPARAVYVALEDELHDLHRRLSFLCKGNTTPTMPFSTLFLQTGDTLDLAHHDEVVRLVATLMRQGPIGLVVIDPFRDAHSADEQSSTQMRRVCQHLRAIARALNATVVVPHHTRKEGARSGSMAGIRGSTAIEGAVDFIISLDNPRRAAGSITTDVRLRLRSGRPVDDFQATVVIDDHLSGSGAAFWSVAPFQKHSEVSAKEVANDVVAFVQTHGPCAKTRIREALGIGASRIDSVLSPLVQAGRLEAIEGERGVRYAIPGPSTSPG